MALSKKDRCLIFDIILNNEDEEEYDFSADEVQELIVECYGVIFSIDDIQCVIDELAAGREIPDRCDKTDDMFEVA